RCSFAVVWPAGASASTSISETGRWFRWRSPTRRSRCCGAPGRSSSLQIKSPFHNEAELGAALREHAYLEGDFVLRSGRRSRYYLDKYRFETEPRLLAGLGRELAALVREHAADSELLAGPELGAVPLASVASVETGLPFLIVRKEAKEY